MTSGSKGEETGPDKPQNPEVRADWPLTGGRCNPNLEYRFHLISKSRSQVTIISFFETGSTVLASLEATPIQLTSGLGSGRPALLLGSP